MLDMRGKINKYSKIGIIDYVCIYVAYLVFKRGFGRIDDPVSVNWKLTKPNEPWTYETSTNPEKHFPRLRDEYGWMEMELWDFVNDTRDI